MFEAVFNVAMTVVVLSLALMVVTCPAWVAGLLTAGRTRTLPVPLFFRRALGRWVVWASGGLVSAFALIIGANPNGGVPAWVFVTISLVGLATFAASLIAAFYIGWTGRARRLARRADAARKADPWGPKSTQGSVPVVLGEVHKRNEDA